jgi:hypothetical protein
MTVRWGDQREYVPRQAQAAAAERREVAGDTNENLDKPKSRALAVIPLRRIFGAYDRGEQRCQRNRGAGRFAAGSPSPAAQTSMITVAR